MPPTCSRLECVCLEVYGTAHTVGLSPPKLDALIPDTLVLVRGDRVTGHAVSSLVGRWSWAFLACRSVFSVFSAVYRFTECSQYALLGLWPSVRRELRAAVGLATVLFATICMPVGTKALVTGTSGEGQCVCTADNTADVIHELICESSEPWCYVPASLPHFEYTNSVLNWIQPAAYWNRGGPARTGPAYIPAL